MRHASGVRFRTQAKQFACSPLLLSGCRESNPGHTHPMGAHYHYATARTKTSIQQIYLFIHCLREGLQDLLTARLSISPPCVSYRNCSGCRYFYKIAGNLLRQPPRLSHTLPLCYGPMPHFPYRNCTPFGYFTSLTHKITQKVLRQSPGLYPLWTYVATSPAISMLHFADILR